MWGVSKVAHDMGSEAVVAAIEEVRGEVEVKKLPRRSCSRVVYAQEHHAAAAATPPLPLSPPSPSPARVTAPRQ